MGRLVDYFVVCGLGPELQSTEGLRGYHGTCVMYQPALLDQFPPSPHADCPPPPPQLPLCVLPGGVELYSTGSSEDDQRSQPRSYPIVLTDGDGSKIYVSCVAFRDPVDNDVAEAYGIPANSFVDKCICLVSHSPCFQVLRDTLEELHRCCFSPTGCSKPLWEIVAHVVTSVPFPSPGKSQVLFAVENHLLSVEAPPKDGFPHADMSFEPLMQCLDIDNVLRFFTAILLERRILLRANKYSILTMAAEAICHLIYPIKWQHVYIPVLFYAGVDYIDAPTPYLMGLHSGVDTAGLSMDGVVVVDLDKNRVDYTEEDIPAMPEPEAGHLREVLLQLVHPNLVQLDWARSPNVHARRFSKPWGQQHDQELRFSFLKFFASILSGYRDFVDNSHTAENVFNTQAFLKKRSRITNCPPEAMVEQLIGSQGFYDFLERGYGSVEAGPNLVDKLQEAMARGQDPRIVLPVLTSEPEIFTVSESSSENPASRSRHCYDRFPASVRTPAQDEKRKATLAMATAALERPKSSPSSPAAVAVSKMESLSPMERVAERDRMVLDIKVKLQLAPGLVATAPPAGVTDDPLSSSEFGTLLALIESDAEGIGGSGFVECISEHVHSGWQCNLSEQQFTAVKELFKTTASRATSRNDMVTLRDALEIAAAVHHTDVGNIKDYIQRHLGALPVWDELRFWEGYFDICMETSSDKTGSYAALVTHQLVVLIQHLAGLGLPDLKAWFIVESIARKNNLGSTQLIKLRGLLSLMRQVNEGYWGLLPELAIVLPSQQQMQQQDHSSSDENQQPSLEAAGIGRSWVQSMFSRDRAVLAQSAAAGRTRGGHAVLDGIESTRNIPQPNVDPGSVLKRGPSGVRLLRGHKASVTALHAGTKSEMGDLIGDCEEAGYFISGSADCMVFADVMNNMSYLIMVPSSLQWLPRETSPSPSCDEKIKMWDPNMRGSELRATFDGHTGTVRAISSDRLRIVSGSDDQRVLVWDKSHAQLLEELKGHDGKVSCVRMLSGERVLTASHDGSVKMWDVRTDTCVATVGRHSSAVLCMDYDDTTGVLAAAGVDGVGNVWDVRAGKQMHTLVGHSKWIRSLRMVGDTIITGSDDWTARVWSVSRGACDTVLACHAGAITSVEYCADDNGIITGSADGMVRIWERKEGAFRCASTVEGVHVGSVLSIRAGERWLAVGAADNSMSLFHRPEKHPAAAHCAAWQLLRTPPRSAAVVRCVASDVERGRICSGARNGLLRLWEPFVNLLV